MRYRGDVEENPYVIEEMRRYVIEEMRRRTHAL
jgi:hypothetical protein